MILLLLAALGPWPHNPSLSSAVVMASEFADNPLIVLTNFGTLGIWVLATMIGWQPTRAEVRRLDNEIARLIEDARRRDERDRATNQAVETLVTLMTNRTLPSLATAATAVAEMPQSAQQSSAAVNRIEDLLTQLEAWVADENTT